jgi:Porin subfamily
MKMMKSLLLGSAAGLVAVTAGHAADLPVKAKPVQYVKVCSLYGAGFYYMPGTDMCLKIGGWVRMEITGGDVNGSMTWGPYNVNVNQRGTSNLVTRERAYITADAREETAYGVARAYIDAGVNSSDTQMSPAIGNSLSTNRAFVQWAGFTAGLATSFFDFYSAPAPLYRAGYLPNEDTGDGGQFVIGYTAQLGNGMSATISAEQRRDTQIIDAYTGSGSPGFIVGGPTVSYVTAGSGYGGMRTPDIVANLRVDQAWGSAQVMGAAHYLNPVYYDGNSPGGTYGNAGPSNDWGWVVGGGIKLLTPSIAPGDYFQAEVNYTEGATRYLNIVEFPWVEVANDSPNANETWGVLTDCVYSAGTSCEKTSAFEVNASFEHHWTPQWHQSLAGAYEQVNYNANANSYLCAAEWGHFGYAPGCNNDWSVWGIGSRLQWDVTKSFYVGVEALYENFSGATGGSPGGWVPNGVEAGTGEREVSSMGDWQFTLRMHKDFLP